MAHAQTRIEHDIVARILDILTERHILATHIYHLEAVLAANALKLAVKIRVRKVVQHLLAARKEAHAGIGYLREIRLRDGLQLLLGLLGSLALFQLIRELLDGLFGILRLHELERAVLRKVVLIPVLDDGKLLVVAHHVVARDDRVELGTLDEFNELRSRKHDIGIDGNKDIIVLAVKGLLSLAAANIEAERLHARKRNERALARADDDVIAVGGNKNVESLCPGKKKGLAKMVTRKADNNASFLLLCGRGNNGIRHVLYD